MEKRRVCLLLLFALCVLFVLSVSASAGVIRVKWDSPSNGPGDSWDNAYHTVQSAINAASAGDEIWVAAGTYVEQITLKKDVALYGGFSGVETERDQRNWVANVAVLDGNQVGSVVTASSLGTTIARIDGFTIRNGKANYGGGIYCHSSSPTISNNTITGNTAINGGGISCDYYSSPTISNNTISGNSAYSGNGGGIYCYSSSPTISNNTISGNSASSGGGIYCGVSSPIISNNTIIGNSGGGIYCYYYSSPTISNNTIAGNSAYYNGGGIYCDDNSSPTISDNTIAGNSAYYNGGGIYCSSSSPAISNNIVAFNSSGIYRSGGSPTLRYNCVYNPNGYNYSGIAPGTGDIQVDPKLCSVEYGNFHIRPNSPCVDAGDSSVVQPGWVDIDGQPRIQGAGVDIGADESDGTTCELVPLIVRVSTSGNDSNDGSSWSSAKRSVQSAIDAVYAVGSGEVWVAAGVYVERITLRNFVHVYGGFSGVETQRDQRNWIANVTILDGNQGGSVVTAINLGSTTARIDGFTIRNGKASDGGGIYCVGSSPTISNNTISGNDASDGGGIYCGVSSPTISNNTIIENSGGGISCEFSSPTISNNTISGNSGGIYCEYNSSPTISNNTIIGNSGGGIFCSASSSPTISNNTISGNSGGGILCSASSPTISNNIISENSASYGGGISCVCSSPTISNNTITANSAYNGGGIYYDYYSSPTISNNTISGNSAYNGSGGGIYCYNSSPAISNNTISGNIASRGGGIYCYSSSPKISNNTISGNSASSGNGGGIYCYNSSPAISNNTISVNSASYGGGIYCYYSSPAISNNIISGNSAFGGNGGGIYCSSSSPAISNNTISGNSASSGGGIYCSFSSPAISNNIVAFNSSGIYRAGGSLTRRNNCVYNPDGYNYSGILPGTGDVQVDPLFVDRVGGDYHLRPNSPCIDAGYDGVVQPDWLDIDGQPRKNGVVDIGSDEYYPQGVQATISEARLLPDGQVVEISDVVVTGAFEGFFYVESADRSAGIQVRKANHSVSVGAKVSIVGVLATDASSGERYISASSIQQVGVGIVEPLVLTNRALGGGDWKWNPLNGAGQRGVSGGVGLNNIGLLVRTTGRVVSSDSGWFVLDDGSGVIVNCVVPSGISVPTIGSYVVVTGISSCERVGDEIRRLLRVRSETDIVTQ